MARAEEELARHRRPGKAEPRIVDLDEQLGKDAHRLRQTVPADRRPYWERGELPETPDLSQLRGTLTRTRS